MNETSLNAEGMNAMILDLIDYKKKTKDTEKKVVKKGSKRNARVKNVDKCKEQMKQNLNSYLIEQKQLYKTEKANLCHLIKSQIEIKEKELNEYYEYCQNFKKEYKENFIEVMKNSEEVKKELNDIHIEYLDNKMLLENKRKEEFKKASEHYAAILSDVQNKWDNKSWDEHLRVVLFDILNVVR